MKARGDRSRRYNANILASFLVIFAGFAACVFIGMLDDKTSSTSIPAAVVVFVFVSIVPLSIFRPTRIGDPEPRGGRGFARFRNWWPGRRSQTRPLKPWKRKNTTFVHTPHGDPNGTFIPEPQPPTSD